MAGINSDFDPPEMSVRKAIKYTTRAQRDDDDPEEIICLTEAAFKQKVDEGEILVPYSPITHGNYWYGLGKRDLRPEKNELVVTPHNDFSSAVDLAQLYGAIHVYIDVNSEEVKRRMEEKFSDIPELLAERLELCMANEPVSVIDENGELHHLTHEQHYFPTYNCREPIADIIVDNTNCDLEAMAERVFFEIIQRILDQNENGQYYVPPVKRLYESEFGIEESILRPEYYKTRSGRRVDAEVDSEHLVTMNRERTLVGLSVIIPWNRPMHLEKNYLVQIQPASEGTEIPEQDRLHLFRGTTLGPVELWISGEGTLLPKLKQDLHMFGFMRPRRIPTDESSYDGPGKEYRMSYGCTYGTIAQFLQQNGFTRLVENNLSS
ncbi:hypothetical protein JXB41_01050 [Candidatus Woesearchaeota archaeon]|nr:hypothetical protein [Candidatus Woesearchaeota archaeon]